MSAFPCAPVFSDSLLLSEQPNLTRCTRERTPKARDLAIVPVSRMVSFALCVFLCGCVRMCCPVDVQSAVCILHVQEQKNSLAQHFKSVYRLLDPRKEKSKDTQTKQTPLNKENQHKISNQSLEGTTNDES